MSRLPVLITPRLTLRPFFRDDAADIQTLAGDFAVADTTLNMPHPYEDGIAEAWISKHETMFLRGEELVLAIAATPGAPGDDRGATANPAAASGRQDAAGETGTAGAAGAAAATSAASAPPGSPLLRVTTWRARVSARALPRAPIVGAIGLRFSPAHFRAELGYWVGRPYWGRGYATEASRALVDHAFETTGLNRIFAQHFVRNPASGRVMQKIGMRYEGRLRQHVQRWDRFEDLDVYGLLRDEWLAARQA